MLPCRTFPRREWKKSPASLPKREMRLTPRRAQKKSVEHYSTTHTLTDMVSCRATLSPLLRSLAGATLLVWLAAWVFCSVDCCAGDSDSQPGHHDEQATASQHDHDQAPDSDNHSGHDDSACTTLKTLVPTASNLVLLKPDFGFCTLSFVSPPQMLTVAQIETPISRQPPDREWLLTPEVCLGPAFRSHAPPVLL